MDLPIENGVFFHSNVSLPEGKCHSKIEDRIGSATPPTTMDTATD